VTVIFRRNETLELNLCEFTGAITLDELKALAKYQADKPDILGSDTLNIVRADGDFSAISLADLDRLFELYRRLFTPLRLQIFRRAVWLCETDAPKAHVSHWLSQDAKEAMSSTVKHCHSFTEAADWLLLTDAERVMVEQGEGFPEIVRYPEPARALVR
jgi:hypothetical protein